MVHQCANQNCSKPLRYLREGRIFAFDVPDKTGPVIGGRIARRREHYWLCGNCFQYLVVVQTCEAGVLVVPRTSAVAIMPGALAS